MIRQGRREVMNENKNRCGKINKDITWKCAIVLPAA